MPINLSEFSSVLKSPDWINKKDIEKNENILASLQDEEYQENSEKLSEKTQRLQRINKSRGKFQLTLIPKILF